MQFSLIPVWKNCITCVLKALDRSAVDSLFLFDDILFFFYLFRFYAAEIAIGLFYLHNQGIIYRYVRDLSIMISMNR